MALLRININYLDLSIILAYAPTEAAKEEDLDLFHRTIDKAIRLRGNKIIVMGNFNAKISQPVPNETITGNYGYGNKNCRGDRLNDFAYENNLGFINTFS